MRKNGEPAVVVAMLTIRITDSSLANATSVCIVSAAWISLQLRVGQPAEVAQAFS